MRNKSNIIALTSKFANKYFPDCKHLMISGSFTEEYFNETSDIDVIILSNLPNKTYIESFYFYDIEFQAIVLPTNQIREILLREVHNSEGVYLSLIQKGKILKDHKSYLEKIQNLAKLLYQNGPKPASALELQLLRGGLTSRLLDLKASNSYSDNLFTIIDAFQRILTLHSKHNRIWLQKSKYASRLLENLDPSFKKDLVTAYSDFVLTKNPQPCISFLTNTLGNFGGQLKCLATNEVTDEVKGDILTIYINSEAFNDIITNLILPLHAYLISRVFPIEFVTLKASRLSLSKDGVYLIIKKNNQFLNEHLIPLIQDFFINKVDLKKKNINPKFPFSTNPLILFGYKSIEPEVFSLLSTTTDYFINKYKTCEFTDESIIQDGVQFVLSIIQILKLTDKQTHSFITYLNDLFLPYSYNLDQDIPYSLLSYEREQLKSKYKKACESWLNQDFVSNNNINASDNISALMNRISFLQERNELEISDFEMVPIACDSDIKTKEKWVIARNVLNELFNSLYIKEQHKSFVIFIAEEILKNK